MKKTDIIEAIIQKLAIPGGRHLYGVLSSYEKLNQFSKVLRQAKTVDGKTFPVPLNVNMGILESIPDDEFRQLVENEAKRPEPTVAHVNRAFEKYLRQNLAGKGLVVLSNLELLFAYKIELNLLRTMAADDDRVLLLLPGKRVGTKVHLFHEAGEVNVMLPINLIAENNLWELRD